MSRLALDWVKKNFSFHGKVDNLEKDFSDGQLFLQILRQRGVLTDEDAINESGTPFAAAENLKLFRLRVQPLNIRLEKANVANVSARIAHLLPMTSLSFLSCVFSIAIRYCRSSPVPQPMSSCV